MCLKHPISGRFIGVNGNDLGLSDVHKQHSMVISHSLRLVLSASIMIRGECIVLSKKSKNYKSLALKIGTYQLIVRPIELRTSKHRRK